MPQQPKLRSSCDGCGSAKVKCDRGQPACRRCISLDQPCFYGVSRKTGKPPRNRSSAIELHTGNTHGEQVQTGGDDRHRKSISYSESHGDFSSSNYIVRSSEAILNDQSINLHTSMNTPNTTLSHLYWPGIDSIDFEDPLLHNGEAGTAFAQAQAEVEAENSATPAPQSYASRPQTDRSAYIDYALLQPAESKDHDCFQEAYDILGSLSFHRINNAQSTSESSSSGSSTTATAGAPRVPLDRVLGVNREACTGLGRILGCSCAKTPQLTLLCASIISQILMWYQQAAGCMQTQSSSPTDTMAGATSASQARSLTGFSPIPGFGPGTKSSAWSSAGSSAAASTAASIYGSDGIEIPKALMPSTRLVVPAKMAIGNFNIDDLRAQTALQTHLLLDEMKRVGRLINHFALHDFDGGGHAVTNDYTTTAGVHSLYESLDIWLRSEHSRIIYTTKERLRDFHS